MLVKTGGMFLTIEHKSSSLIGTNIAETHEYHRRLFLSYLSQPVSHPDTVANHICKDCCQITRVPHTCLPLAIRPPPIQPLQKGQSWDFNIGKKRDVGTELEGRDIISINDHHKCIVINVVCCNRLSASLPIVPSWAWTQENRYTWIVLFLKTFAFIKDVRGAHGKGAPHAPP